MQTLKPAHKSKRVNFLACGVVFIYLAFCMSVPPFVHIQFLRWRKPSRQIGT